MLKKNILPHLNYVVGFFCGLLVFQSISCNRKVLNSGKNQSAITGSVYQASISDKDQFQNFQISDCEGSNVDLFSIDEKGQKISRVGSAKIKAQGRFTFSSAIKSKVNLNKDKKNKFLIQLECNGTLFKRFLTGFSEQNLSPGTTLLSWLSQTEIATDLISKDPTTWASMYKPLEKVSSMNLAFSTLKSDANLKNRFEKSFGAQPDILLNAIPEILRMDIPVSYPEENSKALSVQAIHWSHNYNIAYEWKIGLTVLSNSPNFNFIPKANSQGLHTLEVYIGQKNAAGDFDFTKSYIRKLIPIEISNNVPPTPPPLTLLSSEYTAADSVNLRLSTGALIDGVPYNCRSFSQLAVVEDIFPGLSAAPVLPSSYNFHCSSPGTQSITFNLSGTEGVKLLRLWARDDSGTISSTSQDISITIDKTMPQPKLLSLNGGHNLMGGTTVPISWNSVELHPATNSGALDYTLDGGQTWNSMATGLPTMGTYSWTVPHANSSQVKIRLRMSDLAGNIGTTESASFFSIDSLPPAAPVVSRLSGAFSNSRIVNLIVGCTGDFAGIFLAQTSTLPSPTAIGWQICMPTMTYEVNSGDGLKNIYVFAKDLAGNISASTNLSMTLDQTNPVISLNTLNSSQSFKGGVSQNINWTISDINWGAQKIDLSYSTDGGNTYALISSNVANTGPYLWTLPTINSTLVKVKVSGCDLAGNCSAAVSAGNLTIDSTGPKVTKLVLNNGVNSTSQSNILVNLDANDNLKVTHFCLKLSSANPDITDGCWIPVNATLPGVPPSANISFNNYYHQLGLSKGSYDVKGWARDEVGNISSNIGTAGQDRYIINYDAGTPPAISKGYVSNRDNPSFPISYQDSNINLGGSIFIKWNASDAEGLKTNPISIQYSTDDVNFYSVSGGSSLANGQNGSCSVDAGYTGCANIATPSGGYYIIRIIVEDNSGLKSFMSVNPMNQSSIRIIAGNMDSGLDGSASSAIFNRYVSDSNGAYPAKNKLVVSDDGRFFYIDPLRGLLWIEPSTGLLKTFIKSTGTSTGDGGPVSSATLNSAKGIALDHFNRLIIYDGNKFRRVDLSTMMISTIIGGGAVTSPTSEILALDLKITGAYSDSGSSIITLPNGNIIFNVSGDANYYVYRDSDQKVSKFTLAGPGVTGFPSGDWTGKTIGDLGIKYNPTTSAIELMVQGIMWIFVGDSYFLHSRINPTTYQAEAPFDLPFNYNNFVIGMDGNLYSVPRYGYTFSKYNSALNTKSNVIGNGLSTFSPCVDGTLATSCSVSISAAFVSKAGRIYFNDKGLIRTIDDSGKILTLFGQYASAGDGGLASAARFGSIRDIKFGDVGATNNKLIVLDINASTFRELDIGGAVQHVANTTSSWDGPFRFETDPITGDIFVNDTYYIKRFIRSSSTWQNVVGGGITNYYDATGDGLVGSAIKLSNYRLSIVGLINNKIYRILRFWNGSVMTNSMIKAYDISDSYRQSHFAGDSSNGLNSDSFSGLLSLQDPTDNIKKFFWNPDASSKIYAGTSFAAGTLFASTPHAFYAFTARVEASGINFYYCATNGLLYKFNKNSNTETLLSWASPTLRCSTNTRSILWNAQRSSLIFGVQQNGLHGIAEYPLP